MTHTSAPPTAVSTQSTGEPLLNSDLIRERFGSYHVDILRRGTDTRVSALSSDQDGAKICRTFAVTQFISCELAIDAAVLEHIESGGSIGATLRRAGFEVDKQSLDITGVQIDEPSHAALERMHLDAPLTLALHIYTLGIRDRDVSSPFAIIAELHHPEFLTETGLRELFTVSDKAPAAAVDLERLRAEVFRIGT